MLILILQIITFIINFPTCMASNPIFTTLLLASIKKAYKNPLNILFKNIFNFREPPLILSMVSLTIERVIKITTQGFKQKSKFINFKKS